MLATAKPPLVKVPEPLRVVVPLTLTLAVLTASPPLTVRVAAEVLLSAPLVVRPAPLGMLKVEPPASAARRGAVATGGIRERD